LLTPEGEEITSSLRERMRKPHSERVGEGRKKKKPLMSWRKEIGRAVG